MSFVWWSAVTNQSWKYKLRNKSACFSCCNRSPQGHSWGLSTVRKEDFLVWMQPREKVFSVKISTTSAWYNGFHFSLRKTLNIPGKKVWKKYEKSCHGWSALLPKIKTRWQSLRDFTKIHHPHFLRTFGGGGGALSRHASPVTDGRWNNCSGRPRAALSSDPHAASSTGRTRLARSTARCRLDWAHA